MNNPRQRFHSYAIGYKYNDCKRTYYHIRELSDTLCKEHNLSAINPSQSKGKSYTEWQTEKNRTSLKVTLRKDIVDAINSCSSYKDFIALMKAKGYEIKGEDLTDNNLKYISFRPLDREKFIRGSVRSLSTDYTRERINQLIEEKSKQQTKKTELQKTYNSVEKEVADLNRNLANIKQYLHQEQTPEQSESKKPEQSL